MAELDLFGLDPAPRARRERTRRCLLYFINGELLARADVSVMTHYGFHGGIAMAMLVLSVAGGVHGDRPRDRAGRDRRAGRARSRRSPAGGPGAAWTSRSPTRAATWRRLRTVGTQDADGPLAGQRSEDLHHLGPWQVSLRHRPHGQAATARRPAGSGLKSLSMFLVRAYEDLPDGEPPAAGVAGSPRGKARASRLGDGGADLRRHARRAGREARRGLQADARNHEPRPARRGVRGHRPVRIRAAHGAQPMRPSAGRWARPSTATR